MKHTAKKIQRSLYSYRGFFLVSTERMGNDNVIDWVALKSKDTAMWLLHGNRLKDHHEDITLIHNTLKELKRDVDHHLDKALVPVTPNGGMYQYRGFFLVKHGTTQRWHVVHSSNYAMRLRRGKEDWHPCGTTRELGIDPTLDGHVMEAIKAKLDEAIDKQDQQIAAEKAARPKPLRVKGHKLTMEWSGEHGEESSSTGTCTCGWEESASSQREVRFEYREHLRSLLKKEASDAAE
jgi:hypothetical protein